MRRLLNKIVCGAVLISGVNGVNAFTANQNSVVRYLATLVSAEFIDGEGLFPISASVLDTLSGATYANQQIALAQIDQQFQNEIAARLDGYIPCQPVISESALLYSKDVEDGQAIYTKDVDMVEEGFLCSNQLWWATAYGGEDKLLASEGISGLTSENYGGAIGSEIEIIPGGVLGFAVSYNNFSENAKATEKAHVHGQLYQFGLYGRQDWGKLRFGGSFDYGTTNQVGVDRVIEAPDIISETVGTTTSEVRGSYQATVIGAQARASYELMFYDEILLRPVIGSIYQRVKRHRFTETAADLAGPFNSLTPDAIVGQLFRLHLVGEQYTSLRSVLGTNAEWSQDFFADLFPFVYLAWEHEFGDVSSHFTAGMGNIPSLASVKDSSMLLLDQLLPGGMRITSVKIGRDALAMKAGFTLSQTTDWELAVQYEGRFAHGYNQNGARFEFSYF